MTAAPVARVELPDADATRAFGEALARVLRAGDLVVLTGDLGAGKTTLTQGIGAGLGVRGQVASPTFIIARVHPSLVGGPPLVHVDAYRLGSLEEVDALDLDAGLDESVTVVEWGAGMVEALAQDRLEVTLRRPRGAEGGGADSDAAGGGDHGGDGGGGDGGGGDGGGDGGSDDGGGDDLADASAGTRVVELRGVGARWVGVDLPVVG